LIAIIQSFGNKGILQNPLLARVFEQNSMSIVFPQKRFCTTRLSCWAAFVLGLCCVTSAEALGSCGDYLHVGARASDVKSTTSSSNDLHAGGNARSASHPLIPPRCQGPNCGRGMPLSPPQAPVAKSPRSDEFAVRLVVIQSSPAHSRHVLEQLNELPSAGFPNRVKRPPRF
jgi:hypothetical protein